jgi:tetratricopeptide (TPR) repeat protein/S1-C subfamily serine protease
MKTLLLTALLLSTSFLTASRATTPPTTPQIAQLDENILTPQQVQQTAKNITVRINSSNNGGSGVIIAQKGSNYLILTNAHVVKRATQIEIQAPDGQKYQATAIDGGFDSKYDLALLQFTSKTKYTLANLSSIAGTPIEPERTIYSAGFPFDSKNIRITKGQVSQLTDIPFNDGTQLGYVTDKGEKGIRQGMSGGAIFDAQGNLLGINTIGVAPILPDYTYNDGSKPIAKLKAQYRQANWGIPIYNFLTNVKPDILYGYANLPKVERQVTPIGYMAKLNIKARQMTVRIENSGGSGSGVIIARDASGYYVLTAKHVVQDYQSQAKFTNQQIITADQDRHNPTSTVIAEGVDLAVMKFSSNGKYPVARLGEYSPNNRDFVFVGGFPGREKINSPLWQWQLNPGGIYDKEQGKLQTQNNSSFSNGYDLIYTSISYGGMSGGPVFDVAGNVIGIHGRAESTDLNSLGISIQTFIGLASKLKVLPNSLSITRNISVNLSQEDRNNIMSTAQNIVKPQVGDDGKRWLNYANQLVRTGQYDKAIDAFDRAISKGEILLGSYGGALSLNNIEKYQLAKIKIAQAIAAISPNERARYYYFWKYQSQILENLEKYGEALNSIDTAIILQRESSNKLEKKDFALMNQKAAILKNTKQYSAAILIYDEIIRNQPQSYAYSNRGFIRDLLGDRQEAITDFDQAIRINPTHVGAYNNRGIAKFRSGNSQAAIADYDRAIALNPKYIESYNNRGLAKSALGNKQGAIIDFDMSIAINPEIAKSYSNRGNVKFYSGNKQEAIIDFNRAISLDSKCIECYTNRGVAKSELGDQQGAIIDFDKIISLDTRDVQAYNSRGIAKSTLGNKQGAMNDFNQAILIDSKAANSYGLRGILTFDLGNKQGAIIDMNKAIELFRQQNQTGLYQKAVDVLEKIKRG